MKRLSMLFFVISFLLYACGTEDVDREQTIDESEISQDDNVNALVEKNNELAFDLLNYLREEEESGKNIFISPTSLYMVLSLVYNGADGKTKEEMDHLLGFQDPEILNESSALFLQYMTGDKPGISLHLANGIWLDERYQFQSDFQQNMETYYDAEIAEVPITAPETAQSINDWVEDHTEGRITDMVQPPISNDTVSILINAIYLDAIWEHEFNPELTETEDFYLFDGTTKQVDMMRQTETFEYMEIDGFQAITLPYGEGDMSMQLYLPEEDLTNALETFNYTNWEMWQNQFSEKEGEIILPVFEMEYETSLVEALSSFGLETAFQANEADFSRLVEETDDVFISEVKQKSFLLVDEEGTEAAAATSVTMETTSVIEGEEPFRMEVNRPFFVVIIDEATDTILFNGLIYDPPPVS